MTTMMICCWMMTISMKIEAEETVEEAEASEADDFAEEAPEEEASETEE